MTPVMKFSGTRHWRRHIVLVVGMMISVSAAASVSSLTAACVHQLVFTDGISFGGGFLCYMGFPVQVPGIVGTGSLHALEVDTEGAVDEFKEVQEPLGQSKHV